MNNLFICDVLFTHWWNSCQKNYGQLNKVPGDDDFVQTILRDSALDRSPSKSANRTISSCMRCRFSVRADNSALTLASITSTCKSYQFQRVSVCTSHATRLSPSRSANRTILSCMHFWFSMRADNSALTLAWPISLPSVTVASFR